MTFYAHWRDVPAAAWRWPNFSPAEIACRGTGKLLVNEAALDALQALRASARQAADHPLGLPQPRAQPRRRRRQGVEAHGGHRLRRPSRGTPIGMLKTWLRWWRTSVPAGH